jgi:hypothetical protein
MTHKTITLHAGKPEERKVTISAAVDEQIVNDLQTVAGMVKDATLPERIELARRVCRRPNDNPSDTYLLNEPYVILCFLPHNEATPFATWQQGQNSKTFWGHYFDNIKEAVRDFDTR